LKLWNRLFYRKAPPVAARHNALGHRASRRLQGVEGMEPRVLLSVAPIHMGAVFTELDLGTDKVGDSFEITFSGGSVGTQLTRITISGDQNIKGFGVGDVFFDITADGLGADDAYDFHVNRSDGFDHVRATVRDGTTTLALEFDGFHAGDSLRFAIDVDEVEDYDPDEDNIDILNEGFDPITSGVEFQGSQLTVEFAASDFYDVAKTVEFRNRYDDALIASGLDLPADDVNNQRDRTAGAFAQLQQHFVPASISGFVYHDRSNDGKRDANEDGIGGVTIGVIPVETVDEQPAMTVITDSSGFYRVNGLAPGMYRIVEVEQPTGFLDGQDTVGVVGGIPTGTALNESIESVLIPGGQHGVEYNFGELRPASIRGRVHLSTGDGDCFGDNVQHTPIAGATILLIDGDGNVLDQTVSNVNGTYEFAGLRPGLYGVIEITPDGLIDGDAHVGSLGGQVSDRFHGDSITHIDLRSGDAGQRYDFCEHEPASLSGHVFDDHDNDGFREQGEEGIGDVVVTLYDETGEFVANTTTDDRGVYHFDYLVAGMVSIRETHPERYIDGWDSAGTIDRRQVGRAHNPGDEITDVVLRFGDVGVDYDFAEYLAASIRGRVHLSTRDGDCFGDYENHQPIAAAVVRLFDVEGNLLAETTTDTQGHYAFEGLAPGEYSISEITPEGLIDGGAIPGTIDGRTIGSVAQFGNLVGVRLTSGDQAERFDFCEHEPSTIAGKVYHDRNQNGNHDPTEERIAGVTIQLLDREGNLVAQTITDRNGDYKFVGVRAGQYDLVEIQPTGYLDGIDTPGRVDGQPMGRSDEPGDAIRRIDVGWGDEGTEFNFGENLPATISGRVHYDIVLDCQLNPLDGEAGIEGVTIELLDDAGQVIATTTTNAQGRYEFEAVRPGDYTVREIQPKDFFDGDLGNRIDVTAGSGQDVEEVNFCEIPPATLSGFVFKDGETVQLEHDERMPDRIADIRDGRRTVDDTPIANVTVELRDGITGLPILASSALPGTYPAGPIRLVTDALGFYEFTGLMPGTYSVYQVQPDRFIDGVDTPGTKFGVVFNPGEPVNEDVLQALVVDPQNDAIVRIALAPGSRSIENNFSEINAFRHDEPPELPLIPSIPTPPGTPLPPPIELPRVIGLDPVDLVPRTPWQYISLGDGSDSTRNHTWHLSVIDAGSPRDESSSSQDRSPFRLTDTSRYVNARGVIDLGLWDVGERYGIRAVREESLRLGLRGAVPLTGDFNGDGYDELALYFKGEWFIDINANGIWDADDLWARLGTKDDYPVTGDWDGDGKDDIGIYGRRWAGDPQAIAKEPGLPDDANQRQTQPKNIPPRRGDAAEGVRLLQKSAQGKVRADLIDHVFQFGRSSHVPVVGDWNGDGIVSVGIFHDGVWRLDANGDGKWTDDDLSPAFGRPGDTPIVGDWNGDGCDNLGVYRDGVFILDTNGNQTMDGEDQRVRRGAEGDTPVAGDWDGDGKDEVGVYKLRSNASADRVAKKAG
jgi:serine-aspartate repeat-containing protein C/D/E